MMKMTNEKKKINYLKFISKIASDTAIKTHTCTKKNVTRHGKHLALSRL